MGTIHRIISPGKALGALCRLIFAGGPASLAGFLAGLQHVPDLSLYGR